MPTRPFPLPINLILIRHRDTWYVSSTVITWYVFVVRVLQYHYLLYDLLIIIIILWYSSDVQVRNKLLTSESKYIHTQNIRYKRKITDPYLKERNTNTRADNKKNDFEIFQKKPSKFRVLPRSTVSYVILVSYVTLYYKDELKKNSNKIFFSISHLLQKWELIYSLN